jgi:hypothetical protein
MMPYYIVYAKDDDLRYALVVGREDGGRNHYLVCKACTPMDGGYRLLREGHDVKIRNYNRRVMRIKDSQVPEQVRDMLVGCGVVK